MLNDGAKPRRIQWVDSEWDKVAKELISIQPSLLNSDTLLDMDKATFLRAQCKALPADRQRNPAGIPTVQIVRPRLCESIKKLRREVQQQEAENKALEVQEAQRKAEEEEKAAILPIPPLNPYEAAFAPLIQLIANQVAAILRDDMKQMFTALNPKLAEVEFETLPDVTGKRRVRIVILGGITSQHNDIERSFPNVDFIFIGDFKNSTVDRANGADYIIGMTDFTPHQLVGKMKSRHPEKFKAVSGNTSGVKRFINLLLNATPGTAPTPTHRAANVH